MSHAFDIAREVLPLKPRGTRTGAPRAASQAEAIARPEPPLARAQGIELLGTVSHSGHRQAPALVRRADGQMVQLTPLLYAVLESVDGECDVDAIAQRVSERTARTVTAADVTFLLEQRLRPLGLLENEDGVVGAPRANPLLAVSPRKIITDEKVTRRIAGPFAPAFTPPMVVAVMAAFVGVSGWLFLSEGLAAPLRTAFHEPGLLLMLFGLMMLSAGFHELGHAAACIYGGGKPTSMGVGLYLVWPAFYTDVTDSYRLDRRARLRVDLGGIYFNALFAVLIFLSWLISDQEALLVLIPLQLFQIVRQLVPLVRLDGYHILADLTGVPDLFAHIKPILSGLLPTRWGRPENKRLKPWVRVVVTLWTLAVVPLLLLILGVAVLMFPRLAATAWESAGIQWGELTSAWQQGAFASSAVNVLAIATLALPVAGIAYLVARIVRRTARRVWLSTTDRPVMRAIAALTAAAMLVGLVAAWWPDGQYQPIGRNASGLPVDVRFRSAVQDEPPRSVAEPLHERGPVAPSYIASSTGWTSVSEASVQTFLARDIATVVGADQALVTDAGYRFPKPPPPADGDNQALAINYDDGAAIVDLAFSILLATESAIDNSNQAWALASCDACTTIAAAFQVLLIIGRPDVVIPENVAVAVNVDCATCMTYALAIQLVATLTGPPSPEAWAAMMGVADRLKALEAAAGKLTAEQLTRRLLAIRDEVVVILVSDGVLAPGAVVTNENGSVDGKAPLPSPTPSSSEGAPSPSPTPTPKQESSAQGTDGSSQPSPSPSSSPDASPSPSPTPSSHPSPSS